MFGAPESRLNRRTYIMKTKAAWAACTLLSVGALLGFANGALAFDGTVEAESGSYLGEVYVNSVSGSGCLDKAGYAFIAEVSYPGIKGTAVSVRALETGTDFAVNSTFALTITGGKGGLSPSGTYTWTGSGVGGSWSESGDFTSTITEISTHALVLQLSVKYGSCTEGLNIPLARMGLNQ
jgi:hypothetical protein